MKAKETSAGAGTGHVCAFTKFDRNGIDTSERTDISSSSQNIYKSKNIYKRKETLRGNLGTSHLNSLTLLLTQLPSEHVYS